jgi:hypothetical protein
MKLDALVKGCHRGRMRMRIKLRFRDKPPTPWRWEIFNDTEQRLVTAAAHGYATRDEAYQDGQVVLAELNAAD